MESLGCTALKDLKPLFFPVNTREEVLACTGGKELLRVLEGRGVVVEFYPSEEW